MMTPETGVEINLGGLETGEETMPGEGKSRRSHTHTGKGGQENAVK